MKKRTYRVENLTWITIANFHSTNQISEAEINPDDIEFADIRGTDKLWGLGYTPATRLDLFGEKIDRERITQTTAKIGALRKLGEEDENVKHVKE